MYNLRRTFIEINECASNPCQNQGRCVDHVLQYACVCAAGYTGKNCEIKFNECASNPCQHSAVCHDLVNRYSCTCKSGYTGTNCEIAPSIMIKPSVSLANIKIVLEGSSFSTILCDAEGIPMPSVTWESLEKPSLPHNAKQIAHYLVFENVSSIDGGHYVCTAKNRVGIDIKVVQVIVKARNEHPHVAPVIHAPSTIQVKYYTEARITCNVTGFPTPNVAWIHNDNPVQSSGNTLVIHSVTNATTGTYTCIATNDAGSSQASILLKVTYDVPKIVSPPVTSVLMAGHAHNFTCIATGHPKPTIIWTYNMFTKHTTDMPSLQLLKHDSVLTLYSVNTQDSGLLTCTAQNEFGEDHVSVSVIVRSPNPVG
ncbi:HMCN [Mytilus coruscus]|uniref:HMCN n=1 Tax=Mytilus coruscus TaxID=42192 RepID=A0A6J8DJJ5_MYTCO|nr:HMCN [Mytilus coruscus]